MPASQLVGAAGYIIVIPIVIAAVLAFQYLHPGLSASLYTSFNMDDRDGANFLAFILYVVCTLFIALPGLLLINLSEMAESAAKQNELAQRQIDHLLEIKQVQKDAVAKLDALDRSKAG